MKTPPKPVVTPTTRKMEPVAVPARPARTPRPATPVTPARPARTPRPTAPVAESAVDVIRRRYEALEAKAAAEAARRKSMTYEEVIDTCFPKDLTFLDDRIMYGCLALSGETGEVVEKVKKIIRDKKGHISPDDHVAIIKELGDVLWAVTAIATGLGSNLAEVLAVSKQKFLDRLERGTLQGEGDDR